ncbi:Hypothetical protein, putative, partial [Bodo saltans]
MPQHFDAFTGCRGAEFVPSVNHSRPCGRHCRGGFLVAVILLLLSLLAPSKKTSPVQGRFIIDTAIRSRQRGGSFLFADAASTGFGVNLVSGGANPTLSPWTLTERDDGDCKIRNGNYAVAKKCCLFDKHNCKLSQYIDITFARNFLLRPGGSVQIALQVVMHGDGNNAVSAYVTQETCGNNVDQTQIGSSTTNSNLNTYSKAMTLLPNVCGLTVKMQLQGEDTALADDPIIDSVSVILTGTTADETVTVTQSPTRIDRSRTDTMTDEFSMSHSRSFSTRWSETKSTTPSASRSLSPSLTVTSSTTTSVSNSITTTSSHSSSTTFSATTSVSATSSPTASPTPSPSSSTSTSPTYTPTPTQSLSSTFTSTTSPTYSSTLSSTASLSTSTTTTPTDSEYNSFSTSLTRTITATSTTSDTTSNTFTGTDSYSQSLTTTSSDEASITSSISATASHTKSHTETDSLTATLSPIIAEAIALHALIPPNAGLREVYTANGVPLVLAASMQLNATFRVWPVRDDGTQIQPGFYRHPQPPLEPVIRRVDPDTAAVAVPATFPPTPSVLQQVGTTLPLTVVLSPSYDTETVVNATISFQGGVYLRFAPVIVTIADPPTAAAISLQLVTASTSATSGRALSCEQSPLPIIASFVTDAAGIALPSLRASPVALVVSGGLSNRTSSGELDSVATPDWELVMLGTDRTATSTLTYTVTAASGALAGLETSVTLDIMHCPFVASGAADGGLQAAYNLLPETEESSASSWQRLFRITAQHAGPCDGRSDPSAGCTEFEFYVPFSTLEAQQQAAPLVCLTLALDTDVTVERVVASRTSPAHVRCNMTSVRNSQPAIDSIDLRLESVDDNDANRTFYAVMQHIPLLQDDAVVGGSGGAGPQLRFRNGGRFANQSAATQRAIYDNATSATQTQSVAFDCVFAEWVVDASDRLDGFFLTGLPTATASPSTACSPSGSLTRATALTASSTGLPTATAEVLSEVYALDWPATTLTSASSLPRPLDVVSVREASNPGGVAGSLRRGWEVCIGVLPTAAVTAPLDQLVHYNVSVRLNIFFFFIAALPTAAVTAPLDQLVHYNVSVRLNISATLTLWSGVQFPSSSDSVVITWAPDFACHKRYAAHSLVSSNIADNDEVLIRLHPAGALNATSPQPQLSVALEALIVDESLCHVVGAANQAALFEVSLARCDPPLDAPPTSDPTGALAVNAASFGLYSELRTMNISVLRQDAHGDLLGGFMDQIYAPHNRTAVMQPSIAAATGCTTRDPFPSVFDCPARGTAPITILGENFYPLSLRTAVAASGASVVQPAYFSVAFLFADNPNPVACTALHFVDNSTLVCAAYSGFGTNGTIVLYAHAPGSALALVYASSTRGLVSFVPGAAANCPLGENGLLCSGRGECGAFTGLCTCVRSATEGYWGGADCSICDARFNGSAGCLLACPLDANNVVCSNRGPCEEGLCWCGANWSATACDGGDCPGSGSACSGHGVCDSVLGACRCTDPFAGADCNSCVAGLSGPHCNLTCPTSAADGSVCGGRGACFDGVCYCLPAFCGPACDLVVGIDDCAVCALPGLYGADCTDVCPGGSAATPCTGHGTCSGGRAGTGQCLCSVGYGSADCSVACGLDASGALCAGRGTCSAVSGQCQCPRFYAGPSCSIACPGYDPADSSALVCSGHGSCDEGAAGSGRCFCAAGYNGASCNTTCAAAAVVAALDSSSNSSSSTGTGSVCYGRGTCLSDLGSCFCNADPVLGYWAGEGCDRCAALYAGPDCTGQCPTANASAACSGHGSCGSDLVCSCEASATLGYWAGAACDACRDGFYGKNCSCARARRRPRSATGPAPCATRAATASTARTAAASAPAAAAPRAATTARAPAAPTAPARARATSTRRTATGPRATARRASRAGSATSASSSVCATPTPASSAATAPATRATPATARVPAARALRPTPTAAASARCARPASTAAPARPVAAATGAATTSSTAPGCARATSASSGRTALSRAPSRSAARAATASAWRTTRASARRTTRWSTARARRAWPACTARAARTSAPRASPARAPPPARARASAATGASCATASAPAASRTRAAATARACRRPACARAPTTPSAASTPATRARRATRATTRRRRAACRARCSRAASATAAARATTAPASTARRSRTRRSSSCCAAATCARPSTRCAPATCARSATTARRAATCARRPSSTRPTRRARRPCAPATASATPTAAASATRATSTSTARRRARRRRRACAARAVRASRARACAARAPSVSRASRTAPAGSPRRARSTAAAR